MPSRENSRKVESIILTYFMVLCPFPIAQQGRVTDEHLVLLNAVVLYFSGLTCLLYIIKTYSKDYEVTLPFQSFSSILV